MKLHTLSKIVISTVLISLPLVAPVAANATTGNDQMISTDSMINTHEELHYEQIDLSRMRIISSSHDFKIVDGVMIATDKLTGHSEDLPSTATDTLGNQVTLYYENIGKGEVIVTALLSNTRTGVVTRITRAALNSDVRCWLGTVGSGIGGALGGAAAGSVIPGLGTIAGGIAGAISGNAVGTATFC